MNGRDIGLPKGQRLFDVGKVSPVKYYFFVAGALGLLIALVTREQATPYGLLGHIVQWQIQSQLAIWLLVLAHIGLTRYIHVLRMKPFVQLVVAGLLGGLMFSLPASAMDIIFKVDPAPRTLYAFVISWFDELGGSIFPVCLSWIVINTPWILGLRLTYETTSVSDEIKPSSSQAVDSRPPFADLVRDDIWGDLLYLKAELQYIKVVTSNGQELILYSLRKAMNELPQSAGLQVHRSYWVASPAIELFRSKGRQGELALVDGATVPVSRAKANQVKSLCKTLGVKFL
ncbi:MAG: LytTR family DNA-binding domain-containing protein [Desulfuromonadales bacterium]|jgi:hypothetical protein